MAAKQQKLEIPAAFFEMWQNFLTRKKRGLWGYVGRFPFRKKPRCSVGAKVEFPIGKKLFHLALNPGTSRCPTVDLELVQTTKKVNGTRHSIRKFQPGKRAHLFRFSTFSGNFPVGRAYETCSIYLRTRNSGILTKWKRPWSCSFVSLMMSRLRARLLGKQKWSVLFHCVFSRIFSFAASRQK